MNTENISFNATEQFTLERSELEKARSQNHFAAEDLDTAWLSGDSRNREVCLRYCKNLIALCELYDIKIAGLGIHGSYPVVFVDVKPSFSGAMGKFSEIHELPPNPSVKREKSEMVADFNVTVWDVPAYEKERYIGNWTIEI